MDQISEILLLVIAAAISRVPGSTSSPPAISSQASCSSASHSGYHPGEVWSELVEKDRKYFCRVCRCFQVDKANCTVKACSADVCDSPTPYDKDCCQMCKAPPTLPVDPPAGPQVSCLHNGRVYQDGQEFASNFTRPQTDKPNQCVQCVCQGGLVLCRLKVCPVVRCATPLVTTSDCCPSCPGGAEEPRQPADSPVLITIMLGDEGRRKDNKDCPAGDLSYQHGSSWHPVIGPFGEMDCVICKCLNARIECSRVSCPPPMDPSCDKPLRLPGQCCPSCGVGITVTSDIKDKVDSLFPAVDDSRPGGQSRGNLCLPAQTNTVVHKSHASISSSGYYQYAFQLTGSQQNTRLLSWTVKDGELRDFSEQHLSKDEFSVVKKTFKFKLLGATKPGFLQKFVKKVKRFPEKCGQRCSAKIARLERVLHLQEIATRHQCHSSEVQFQK